MLIAAHLSEKVSSVIRPLQRSLPDCFRNPAALLSTVFDCPNTFIRSRFPAKTISLQRAQNLLRTRKRYSNTPEGYTLERSPCNPTGTLSKLSLKASTGQKPFTFPLPFSFTIISENSKRHELQTLRIILPGFRMNDSQSETSLGSTT